MKEGSSAASIFSHRKVDVDYFWMAHRESQRPSLDLPMPPRDASQQTKGNGEDNSRFGRQGRRLLFGHVVDVQDQR